jgi:hypothetical protein
MGLGGPEMKNYCTGDGRQQFISPGSWHKNVVMDPVGPRVKNDRAGEEQQQFSRNRNKPDRREAQKYGSWALKHGRICWRGP